MTQTEIINKIFDLATNWPGDQDNFIKVDRLPLDMEMKVVATIWNKGFQMTWTGRGYILVIRNENMEDEK